MEAIGMVWSYAIQAFFVGLMTLFWLGFATLICAGIVEWVQLRRSDKIRTETLAKMDAEGREWRSGTSYRY